MFLKAVELFGFKSFADRTRFEFKAGLTSLLGPNGSGKSNVVDSIKWVLGSQSPSAIRAVKREDVIFNGTDTRKPMPSCEVKLLLDNSEKLLNIDASEVEITRRMNRNGENEYFINRDKVLLRNIKELFMDTGVGKTAYSILEQGKIDQILSLKPEDRRYIFEEAAGISRFKQQTDDANRKLQKTDENMAKVDIQLKEAEKIYTSRKVQMERVVKKKELEARRESLDTDLQLSYLDGYKRVLAMHETNLKNAGEEDSSIKALLDTQREGIDDKQKELEKLRQEREELNISIHRAEEQKNSFSHDIDIYNGQFEDASRRAKEAKLRAQNASEKLERDRLNYKNKFAEYENIQESIKTSENAIKDAEEEIENLESQKIVHEVESQKLLEEIDSIYEERKSITEEMSMIANDIADSLEKNVQGSGYSSSSRKSSEKAILSEFSRMSTVINERLNFFKNISSVDFEKSVFIQQIEDSFDSIFQELNEIKGLFQEYSASIPTFLDDFISPEGILSKKAELDKKLTETYTKETDNRQGIDNLKSEIQRIERLLILKKSDLADLKEDSVRIRTRYDILSSQIAELKDNLSEQEYDFSSVSRIIDAEEGNVNDVLEKIDITKIRIQETVQRITQMRDILMEKESCIDSIYNEINSKNEEFKGLFKRQQELIGIIAQCRTNIEAMNETIQRCYVDFFDRTGKSLHEFDGKEVTEDVKTMKAELEDVKTKLVALGMVNYMAEEEYNEAKKNYDFFFKNMEDLRKAKEDIEEVIEQIRKKSEDQFMDAYRQISVAFEQMFTLLFDGGKAQLSLEDEENVLESGINILAQPPGKKLTNMNLLSGGEKSMTAVALLFATYKVKPSPFCILDEIDAALDARNIGAFMQALRQFGDKSQFIIITHNKNTVQGTDCLLGVTQQELGVSKMISYSIENVSNDENAEKLKG